MYFMTHVNWAAHRGGAVRAAAHGMYKSGVASLYVVLVATSVPLRSLVTGVTAVFKQSASWYLRCIVVAVKAVPFCVVILTLIHCFPPFAIKSYSLSVGYLIVTWPVS